MTAGLRPLAGLLLGLCLALAARGLPAAAAGPDWGQAQTVTVRLTEYRFIPSHLLFRHDLPYHLHLVNPGKEAHEFTAAAFFATVALRTPATSMVVNGDVYLRPGEAADLYFVPQQTGQYDLRCADHDWAGMVGDIVVE